MKSIYLKLLKKITRKASFLNTEAEFTANHIFKLINGLGMAALVFKRLKDVQMIVLCFFDTSNLCRFAKNYSLGTSLPQETQM